jgi:hypothetical protein
MRKRIWGSVKALCFLLFLMLPGTASASTSYYGCYTCEYRGIVGIGETCRQVAPDSWGDGWICYEDNSMPWPAGPECWTNGQACYNIVTGGNGGSGGGGTGGGQTCQTSGFCPAECFSCGGGPGRPAV